MIPKFIGWTLASSHSTLTISQWIIGITYSRINVIGTNVQRYG